MVRPMAHLWSWFAGSPMIGLVFIGSLQTMVWQATYEQLGGFRADLVSVLDIEMWVRIAANFPVFYEPQILAFFRRHGTNQSVMDERTGANMQDMARAIEVWKDYFPAHCREQLEQQSRRYWSGIALMLA